MATQMTDTIGVFRFFVRYFKNFHKILLTNIIFAIPVAVFSALLSLINNSFFNGSNIVIMLLAIVFCYPFFSGVTLVTRNIMRGDDDVKTIPTFFKGVKENFKKFICHGVFLYLAVLLSYFAILFYLTIAKSNAVFYAPLFVCIILAVVVFFMFFHIPLLTVTFDLKLRDIYKNSALMSFGEIKNNILATLGLFLLFIFSVSCVIFCTNAIVLQVILFLLIGFIIPSTYSAIVNFAVYDSVLDIMTANKTKTKEKENEPTERQKSPQIDPEEFKDVSSLIVNDNGNGDEYIFHNGKMVKRSVLLREMNMTDDALNDKKDV